jgi:sulfide:quinone oxidoreductase
MSAWSSPVRSADVLVAGGGVAGVEALMALADLGDRRLRVHVVSPRETFVLRPQMVGEPWGGAPLRVSMHDLCADFGATFRRGTLVAVDAGAKVAVTQDGARQPYAHLLVATGAVQSVPCTGVHVLGFGHLPELLAVPGTGDVAIVVPPKTTWALPAYELALLVAGGGSRRAVRVLTAEEAPLEVFGDAAAGAVAELLAGQRVGVETACEIAPGSDAGALASTVVALPLLDGPRLAGLPSDAGGFVRVDGDGLAVPGVPGAHAAGDVIAQSIKQGGLAAQQADAAAAAIAATCGAKLPAMPYAPVLRGKLVCPDGTELYLRRALDGRDPGEAREEPLWRSPGVVTARRLSTWLARRRAGGEPLALDHVSRPDPSGQA